jgi:hypothetical protein
MGSISRRIMVHAGHGHKCKTVFEKQAKRQWLTPVILSTQEAEIRNILV